MVLDFAQRLVVWRESASGAGTPTRDCPYGSESFVESQQPVARAFAIRRWSGFTDRSARATRLKHFPGCQVPNQRLVRLQEVIFRQILRV